MTRSILTFWLVVTAIIGCSKASDNSEDSPPVSSTGVGSCNVILKDVQSYCYEYTNFADSYLNNTLKPRCADLSAGKPLVEMATTWATTGCKAQGKVVGCSLIPTEVDPTGQVVVWYYDAETWASAIAGCPAERVIQP